MPRALIAIVLMGLCVRVAWCVHLPAGDNSLAALPDQIEYLSIARNFLSHGTFVFHDPRFDADIYAYRTPGYPLLIAICGGSIRAVRMFQAFLDASTILAVYLLARRWLSKRSSSVAAAIVAVNPYLIYFAGLLLGETAFTTLLAWGMLLLTGKRRWIGMIVLAAGAMVRPSAVWMPAVLTFFLAPSPNPLPAYDSTELVAARARGLQVVLAFMITLAFFSPWAFRNHARLGSWIWLTTNGGITLYDGFNPSATGGSDQTFATAIPNVMTLTEVERDRAFRHAAIDYIEAHPGHAAALTVSKILRTWSPIPLSESYKGDVRTVIVGGIYAASLFALTCLGLCGRSLTPAAKGFLLAPAIYITLVHGLSVGSLRYRIPADVPLAIIASGGIKFIIDHLTLIDGKKRT